MSSSTRTICFVTDELYPFTAGGLGRLLYNLFKECIGPETQCHVVAPLQRRTQITETGVRAEFGANFHVHYVDFHGTHAPEIRDGMIYGPPGSFGYTRAYQRSHLIYRGLVRLAREEGLRFDYIEFPDFFGLAFCTVQARRLGDDFADTRIAVRLHSTMGIIGDFEGTMHTWDDLVTADLERKALHDADIVVAHLADIAAFNRRFYDFDEAWLKKVVVERPPVRTDGLADAAAPAANERCIGFTGRIQRFKRPNLFVQGCELYLHRNAGEGLTPVFACHVQDRELLDDALARVSPGLRGRFLCDARLRGGIVTGGIVAMTSDYESYCLAAYETSQLGGLLVLNERCIAFNDNAGWKDGVNCIKFDGTARGLAAALERAAATRKLTPFAPQPDTPYWDKAPKRARAGARKAGKAALPRIGVSILQASHDDDIASTLASLESYAPERLETVLCRTGSAREETRAQPPVTTLDFPDGASEGVIRNTALGKIASDYVLLLHAGDRISETFLKRAAACLETSPEYDGVVPQSAVYRATPTGEIDELSYWATYLGESPALSMVRNKIAGPGYLVRKETLARAGFDEGLPRFAAFAALAGMTMAGARFVVTNTTDLFCQCNRDEFDTDPNEFWTRFHKGNALKHVDVAGMVRPKYLFRAFQTEMISDVYWHQVGERLKRPTHQRVSREIRRFLDRMSKRRARRRARREA